MSKTETVTQQSIDDGLKERFEQIGYDTLEGNRCQATVTNISERRSSILVSVELPSGRSHTESYEIPEVNSDTYEFVRLLNGIGYGLVAVDEVIGSTVTVEITNDGPEIIVPEREKSIKERLESVPETIPEAWITPLMVVGTFLTWPISGLSAYTKWHTNHWSFGPEPADWIIEYGFVGYSIFAVMWLTISVFVGGLI